MVMLIYELGVGCGVTTSDVEIHFHGDMMGFSLKSEVTS
jgi:hypothetical protein